MQLMPATARLTAKRWGINLSPGVYDPATNIQLGCAYLKQMYDNFGHYALATASYNAGPGRIPQWRPAQSIDADIWIENIPFTETRTYVKRVMDAATGFETRLNGKTTPASTRLPPVASKAERAMTTTY